MADTRYVVNELLVDLFNDIIKIESNVIKQDRFKDLTLNELHIMEAMGLESKTMTEVAATLDIAVSTLTTAINKMVKKGYVEREQTEEDRRRVYIKLTRKGEIAYRAHDAFHQSMVNTVIEGLNEEETVILTNALKNLIQFFKERYPSE